MIHRCNISIVVVVIIIVTHPVAVKGQTHSCHPGKVWLHGRFPDFAAGAADVPTVLDVASAGSYEGH